MPETRGNARAPIMAHEPPGCLATPVRPRDVNHVAPVHLPVMTPTDLRQHHLTPGTVAP